MFKNRRFLLSAGIEVFLICLWGGIYDFTAALYGTIFASALVFTSWKRGKLFIPGGIETVGLGIMLAGYILSACLARDKGVAFVGVIRFASVCLFWILWNNLEDSLRERLRGWLPRIAAALTGAAVVLYISPYFRELLFRAGRLGGVFQYSNTYALFLLIGIAVGGLKDDVGAHDPVQKDVGRYFAWIIVDTDNGAFESQLGRCAGCLSAVVGLGAAGRHYHGGPAVHGLLHQVFQLADLVAAHGQRCHVIAFNVKLHSQIL